MNNTEQQSSKQLSFWQLLSEAQTSIEIPVIQRDYAQGRPGKEEIRKNFLEALHSALKDGKPIELDFVYGNIQNRQNGPVLQPLDGQQRLTTLFLLHWYAANLEGAIGFQDCLYRFTYETRASSREFCTELVREGINFNSLPPAGDKNLSRISEAIEDATWFFRSWKKDPTISAMLTMLDSIDSRFHSLNGIWEKLTKSNIVTFHYLPMKNFGLSDDLYIKMNARGKPLTDFENFKARLEKELDGLEKGSIIEKGFLKNFSKKIDGPWADMFWNMSLSEGLDGKFDSEFINFFYILAAYQCAVKSETNPSLIDGINQLRGEKKLKSIPFSRLVELGLFSDGAFVKQAAAFLDKVSLGTSRVDVICRYLPTGSVYLNETETVKQACRNERDFGYSKLVLFYGYLQFLVNEPNLQPEDPTFTEWMRVIRNLVEGSSLDYYNTVDDFARSIRAIGLLLPHRNNIVDFLAKNEISFGFNRRQVEEERTKALLLQLTDTRWREEVQSAENHPYFKGQIGFLLDFAEIRRDEIPTWNSAICEQYYQLFTRYAKLAEKIFGTEGISEEFLKDSLFQRAMLATGDYMLQSGQNRSFLTNDLKKYHSWKIFIREEKEGRKVLKSLFDSLDVSSDLTSQFQKIINNFSDPQDWRYYFVKIPSLIQKCELSFIRKYNDQNILILQKSQTNGLHAEYYSLALYEKIKHLLINIPDSNISHGYEWANSVDYYKYFWLKNGEINKYITYNRSHYLISDSSEFKNSIECTTHEDVIKKLQYEAFLPEIIT